MFFVAFFRHFHWSLWAKLICDILLTSQGTTVHAWPWEGDAYLQSWAFCIALICFSLVAAALTATQHIHPLFFFFTLTSFFFFFFNAVWLLQTGQIRRQSSQLQRGSDQTWGQRRECGLAKPRKEILGDALAWQWTLFLTVHHILAECKYQDKIFICTFFFFFSNFLLQGLLNANRDIGRNGVQWRVLHYFWSFVFVHFVFSSFGVGWRETVREFIDFLLLPFLYLFTQGVLSVTHYTRPKSHVMPTRVTSKLSPTMILS